MQERAARLLRDARATCAAQPRFDIATARDDANWRKHSLAWVEGNKVTLDYRAVHTDPLTTEAQGGIALAQIAPTERKF